MILSEKLCVTGLRLYLLIFSISENLFVLKLRASRQYCKVFKVIESQARLEKIKVDTLTYYILLIETVSKIISYIFEWP